MLDMILISVLNSLCSKLNGTHAWFVAAALKMQWDEPTSIYEDLDLNVLSSNDEDTSMREATMETDEEEQHEAFTWQKNRHPHLHSPLLHGPQTRASSNGSLLQSDQQRDGDDEFSVLWHLS